uniref:Predicted protein n=1 Tax=Hordeum vulgare subsp. vulgare TaxID=112509 RepID=F2EIY9_HORVV|nr:predicted protein [Hordeum vulgare subsp. vulgare]
MGILFLLLPSCRRGGGRWDAEKSGSASWRAVVAVFSLCSSAGVFLAELRRASVVCRSPPPPCFFWSNGDLLEPLRLRSLLSTRHSVKGGSQVRG